MENRSLSVMAAIQDEKAKDIEKDGQLPLDPEGAAVAEHCRFSFDIIDTPVDPKR